VVGVADESARYRDHGWLMWATWCLCAWLMIATKRYMKKGWFISQLCHSAIGMYITVATIYTVITMLQKIGFDLQNLGVH